MHSGSRRDWKRSCGADGRVDYWPTGQAPDDNRHPGFDPNSDRNADWIALAWLATFDFASTDTVKLKQYRLASLFNPTSTCGAPGFW